MCRGISTNPLSCHGFRSSTWEKAVWDIPTPTPTLFDLLGSWMGLENYDIHLPSPFFLLELRNIQACPGCGKRSGQSSSITQRLFSLLREEKSFKGGMGRTQAAELSIRARTLEPNNPSPAVLSCVTLGADLSSCLTGWA